MRDWLRSLCFQLPIVREVREIRQSMVRIEAHLRAQRRQLRLVETGALVQALDVIKRSDSRYRDPKRLLAHGAQFWFVRTMKTA